MGKWHDCLRLTVTSAMFVVPNCITRTFSVKTNGKAEGSLDTPGHLIDCSTYSPQPVTPQRWGVGGPHKLNKCDQSAPLLPALHWMSPLLGTAAASAKLQTVTFASAALEAMEEQQNNSAPWSVTMEMCPTSFAGLSGRFFEALLSRSLYSPITHNYTPSLGQIKKTQQLLVLFSWVN